MNSNKNPFAQCTISPLINLTMHMSHSGWKFTKSPIIAIAAKLKARFVMVTDEDFKYVGIVSAFASLSREELNL